VKNAFQTAYLTIRSLTVTLTFDLLNSKLNQFIFVPTCTADVNLVRFPPADYKILCQQTFSI